MVMPHVRVSILTGPLVVSMRVPCGRQPNFSLATPKPAAVLSRLQEGNDKPTNSRGVMIKTVLKEMQ